MNLKEEIIGAVQTVVDATIKKVCPVITFGVVTSVQQSNKCTANINGVSNIVSYYGQAPKINSKYPVFIPFGKMNLSFIITNGDNGHSGGTSDYNSLENKPSINGISLVGNKTASNLNLSTVKYNTTNGWNNQPSLMSELNVIYVYTDYYDLEDGKKSIAVKIGDGKGYVIDLPFVDSAVVEMLNSHIYDEISHITDEERNYWNGKVRCYFDNVDNLIFTTDY